MNAIQSNGSTSGSPDDSGSIQSLNLGSYCVDQVAELINWSNASSFSFPKRSPWVQIDSADQPDQPRPSTVTAVESDNHFSEDTVDESAAEVDPSLDQPTGSNEEAEPEVTPAESVSEPVSLSTPEPEPATELEPSPELELESEAASDNGEMRNAEPKPVAAVTKETTLERPPSTTVTSQPITKTPLKGTTMEVREPIAMETDKIPSVDSSEYLRRLESLVLDLNMQLARVTNDVPDQDGNVTTWLRKRVIELSLENMALHEQLHRSS